MARGTRIHAIVIVIAFVLFALTATTAIPCNTLDSSSRQAVEGARLGGVCARDFECVGKLVCIDTKCEQSENWEELSRSAVISISIGAVVVICVLICVGYFCCCCVKKNLESETEEKNSKQPMEPPVKQPMKQPVPLADVDDFAPFHKPASLLQDYKTQSEGGEVKDNSKNSKLNDAVLDKISSLHSIP